MARFASTGLLLFILVCVLVDDGKCQHSEPAGERDLCKTNPCANKGICVQTNVSPGFKCQCYGTGFHGTRCKQGCPKTGAISATGRRQAVPVECIII